MTTAAADNHNVPIADDRNVPLPLRGDTFLGVFEALGQDLAINPNWLRVPFAAALLWNPEVVVGIYFALAVAVALSRWLVPAKSKAAPDRVSNASPASEPSVEPQKAEAKDEELAVAA